MINFALAISIVTNFATVISILYSVNHNPRCSQQTEQQTIQNPLSSPPLLDHLVYRIYFSTHQPLYPSNFPSRKHVRSSLELFPTGESRINREEKWRRALPGQRSALLKEAGARAGVRFLRKDCTEEEGGGRAKAGRWVR